MKFLAVILFCQNPAVYSCGITSQRQAHDTLLECQQSVEDRIADITASGIIALGYCATVDTGITI